MGRWVGGKVRVGDKVNRETAKSRAKNSRHSFFFFFLQLVKLLS